MMTLYLVFERLSQGRLKPTTKMRVSARGAGVQPSKLGLRVGDSITVRDAIKALVTKSANDVAVTVAEHIAGSEAAFARLMNRKARHFGMTRTTFKNASGLPNKKQLTSARDMLTLALRLSDDFPRYYRNFALRSFTYRGRRYRSHNRLLKTFRGTDGIKTGYTRAAGFNLVASVRRDGKHVLGVVFGERSAAERNKRLHRLLSKALVKASVRRTRKRTRPEGLRITRLQHGPKLLHRGKTAAQRRVVVRAPTRRRRHVRVGASRPAKWRTRTVAHARPTPAPRPAPIRRPAPALRSTQRPGAMTSLVKSVMGSSNGPGRAPSTLQDQAVALALPGRYGVLRDTHPASPAPPSYQVQVGAYARAQDATSQLSKVSRRAGRLLGAHAAVTQSVHTPRGVIYRARYSGFDATAAGRTCKRLRRLGIACHVARVR
jgi:D-alanyl-D-alanine carboxypeptidase